jgi:hypothetical protein
VDALQRPTPEEPRHHDGDVECRLVIHLLTR